MNTVLFSVLVFSKDESDAKNTKNNVTSRQTESHNGHTSRTHAFFPWLHVTLVEHKSMGCIPLQIPHRIFVKSSAQKIHKV